MTRSTKFAPFVGFNEWDANSQRWLVYAEADPRRPASAAILSDNILKSRQTIALTVEELKSGKINPRPQQPDRPPGSILDPANLRIGLGRGLVKRYGSALGSMSDTYDEIARQFPLEQAPVLFCRLQQSLIIACEEAREWEATNADASWRTLDDSVKRGRLRLKEAAKAARTLAKIFASHPEMAETFCDLATIRSRVFLATSVAKGQPVEQAERVPSLARWLATLAEAMGEPSAKKRPWFFGHFYANLSFRKSKITAARPDAATCLSFELAHLLRRFTGPMATQDRWAGELMPETKAHWSHVAAFVNAAELKRGGRSEMFSRRQCQNAVARLLRDNPDGVRLRPWRDGRRVMTTP